jgi:hypothetical protein
MVRSAFAGAAAIVACCALAACAGHSQSGDGQTLATVGKAASDYYCAPDPKVTDEIVATLHDADEDAYQDAIHEALPVPPGTRVRVLQRADSGKPKIEVRVESGVYSGDTCWYPSGVRGLLAD